MPTTLERPKRAARKATFTAGLKPQVSQAGVIKVLAGQPTSGMTIPQIAAAHTAAETARLRAEVAALQEQLQAKLQALNAAEVPKVVLPELHDGKTGRIDAQAVAEFMGVPLKRLAEGLGLDYKAVHRNPSAAGFQTALQPVKRSLELLEFFFKEKATIRVWLNTPHPLFENQTSMAIIMEGKAFAVARILGCAWSGGGL